MKYIDQWRRWHGELIRRLGPARIDVRIGLGSKMHVTIVVLVMVAFCTQSHMGLMSIVLLVKPGCDDDQKIERLISYREAEDLEMAGARRRWARERRSDSCQKGKSSFA